MAFNPTKALKTVQPEGETWLGKTLTHDHLRRLQQLFLLETWRAKVKQRTRFGLQPGAQMVAMAIIFPTHNISKINKQNSDH